MNRTSLTSLLRGWKRGAGKRLPALLAAGALAAMLNSCGDNVVETKSESQRIKDASNKTASVSIYIRNGGGTGDISNENVAIEFYGTSGTSYEVQSINLSTETKGKYHEVFRGGVIFKDVPIGTYAARVSKSDYATFFIKDIIVKDDIEDDDVLVPGSVTHFADLYPLTGTVTGTAAYAALSKGKASGAANGATVTLRIGRSEIESRIFTKTAGSDGKFEFTGVPAGAELTGTVTAILDGYESKDVPIRILPGVTSPLTEILDLTYIPGLKLASFSGSVEAEEDIVLEFSDNLVAGSVNKVSLLVTGVDGDQIDADFDVSGSTVKISPKSGSWQRDFKTGDVKLNDKISIEITRDVFSTNNRKPAAAVTQTISVSTALPEFYILGSPTKTLTSTTAGFTVKFNQPVDQDKFGTGSYSFTTDATPPVTVKAEIKTPSFNTEGDEISFEPTNNWPITSGSPINLVFTRKEFLSEAGVELADGKNVVSLTLVSTNHAKLAIETVNGNSYKLESAGAQKGYNKVNISDSTSSVVFVFNKPVLQAADLQVVVTKENAKLGTGAVISVNREWSNENKTLTVTPRNSWELTDGAGHVVQLVNFAASASDAIQGLPAEDGDNLADIAALVVFPSSAKIEYTGKTIISLPRSSKEPVTLTFSQEIDEDVITSASPLAFTESKAPFDPLPNLVNLTLGTDKKSLILTPVVEWVFGGNEILISLTGELKGAGVTSPKVDATNFKVTLVRPVSSVKTAQVKNVKILKIADSLTGITTGKAVTLEFDRIGTEDADWVYKVIRVTPNAPDADKRAVEWDAEVKGGGLATRLKIDSKLGDGINHFHVVAYDETDRSLLSEPVSRTTSPTLAVGDIVVNDNVTYQKANLDASKPFGVLMAGGSPFVAWKAAVSQTTAPDDGKPYDDIGYSGETNYSVVVRFSEAMATGAVDVKGFLNPIVGALFGEPEYEWLDEKSLELRFTLQNDGKKILRATLIGFDDAYRGQPFEIAGLASATGEPFALIDDVTVGPVKIYHKTDKLYIAFKF